MPSPTPSAVNTETHDSQWDLIIRPKGRWFDLQLVDLWRYRDLIGLFVRRDFVAQYKQTILGPIWFVLQPLLTTVVFTIVFGRIAGLPTDGLPRTLFYFSGQVVWGYFAGCLTATSNTFVGNAHVFGKVYFPRLTVPVSIIISQLFQFALRLVFLAGFIIYFAVRGSTVHVTPAILLLPLAVVIMAALSLGLGIIFSSLTTKYRDLRFLLQFGVQLLMYATPAIYPLSQMKGPYRLAILANPMTPIIEVFRDGCLGAGTWSGAHLLYSAGFAAVALVLGLLIFHRVERTFMDTV